MRSERPSGRRDAGMATAELAACLPVLVLVLAVALSALGVVQARVQAQDAAAEFARAAARGDPGTGRRLALAACPGARLSLTHSGDTVIATVTERVHLLGGVLPGDVPVSGRAVAAVEPGTGGA